MAKGLFLLDYYINMCLLNIPSAISYSSPPKSFSLDSRDGFKDLCSFSFKTMSDAGHQSWLTRPSALSTFQFISTGNCWSWVQDSGKVIWVLPLQQWQTTSLWTSLCALGHCHAGTFSKANLNLTVSKTFMTIACPQLCGNCLRKGQKYV